jgi:hypothetical protein
MAFELEPFIAGYNGVEEVKAEDVNFGDLRNVILFCQVLYKGWIIPWLRQ